MNRIFWTVFLSFFLSGCVFLFPSNKAEFFDFTPQEIPEIIIDFDAQKEGDFAQKNFPGNCEWNNLERVVDGDTLVIEDNVRVRFIGIDTPETKHPTKKVQPFGIEASKKSQEFLENTEKVCLMTDSIGDSYDKYARRLAYIFSEGGIDVNAELVRIGLAKAYIQFPFSRKEEFLFLESLAKEEKLGIWSD